MQQNESWSSSAYRDMEPEIIPGVDVTMLDAFGQIVSSAAETAAHASR